MYGLTCSAIVCPTRAQLYGLVGATSTTST
jgi:hypothetical protein